MDKVDKYGGGTVVASIATHACPYCNLKYGSLAGVAQHLVMKHPGEPIPSSKQVKWVPQPDWMRNDG